MSNYVNDLNDLITAKSEIKNIIQNTLNENPSEVFSYYPSYIARIAEAAGGDLSYYVTYSYLYSYVGNALDNIDTGVDLSSYVTYDFLSSQSYATTSAVDQMIEAATVLEVNAGGGDVIGTDWKDVLEESGLITAVVEQDERGFDIMDIHQHIDITVETWLNLSSYVTQSQLNKAGYLTSIPNTYPTYTAIENMAYITMADVSACGYVTANDIDMSGYLPTTGGTLSGNLVPSQSASYNLGSSSSRWKEIRTKSAYADNAYLQGTSYSSSILPKESNTYTLGDESNLYAASYTQSVKIIHPSRAGWIISSEGSGNEMQLKPFNAQRTINVIDYYGNKMLRMYANSASTNYAYSYCVTYFDKPVYFNDTTNLIWTGTSAEYAALSDYTTYQIYLIQEV